MGNAVLNKRKDYDSRSAHMVRLQEPHHAAFKELAKEARQTLTTVVHIALETYLDKCGKKLGGAK